MQESSLDQGEAPKLMKAGSQFSSPLRLQRSLSTFEAIQTPLQNLFYGKVKTRKADGQQDQEDELMTESILTVTQFPAFYQAWEESLKNSYQSENGEIETTNWISKMPKVLSFMLNRIVWEDNNPVKKNTKMEIEKQIFPDRFMGRNQAESLRIRENV